MMPVKAESVIRQVTIAVLTAFVLWIGSFIYATFDEKRKNELALVRGEIGDLYGPMYTLSDANRAVWRSLDSLKPKFDENPTVDDVKKWRSVIETVLIPLDKRMEDNFLSNKQSIRCEKTRECFRKLLSYAESVKITAAGWSDDLTVRNRSKEFNLPNARYPSQIPQVLEEELDALHTREDNLEKDLSGLMTWGQLPACEPIAKDFACTRSESVAQVSQ